MSTYTVTGVAEAARDWNSQLGGAMKGYRIDLQDPQGNIEALVEWSRKAASPAPSVGMVVEGDIEQGQYGKKFKKAQSSSTFGGPTKDFKADPVKQAAIAMESAQKSAVEIARLALEHNLSSGDVERVVIAVADTLYAQITKASEAAK